MSARTPRHEGVLRAATSDFYFHSLSLVFANVLWGVGLVGLLVASSVQPLFMLLAPLLALPTVGIFRVATLVVRGETASFRDGFGAWRMYLLPTLLLGAALASGVTVLLVNIAFGMASGSVIGWSLATMAGWGLVVTWLVGWAAWALLVDPRRSGETVRVRLRTAALLVVAEPVRMVALGASLAVLIAVSTILFAALVTVSVAFAAVLCARVVLPAADRLDARLARGPGSGAAGPA